MATNSMIVSRMQKTAGAEEKPSSLLANVEKNAPIIGPIKNPTEYDTPISACELKIYFT